MAVEDAQNTPVGEPQDRNGKPATAESQEYIDAMTAKADQGLDVKKTGDSGLLAGKYKTEADLDKGIVEALTKKYGGDKVAAYKELEKMLGAAGDDDPGDGAETQDDAGDADETQDTDAEDTEDTGTQDDVVDGLDTNQMIQEYLADGQLSAESKQQIMDAYGISSTEVDVYLRGISATYQDMTDRVGGAEKYNEMVRWAAESMTPAEIERYDGTLAAGELGAINDAVDALYAKYIRANGAQPKRRISGAAPTSTGGYNSHRELVADQKDPRYATDPAFRQRVMDKLSRSKY